MSFSDLANKLQSHHDTTIGLGATAGVIDAAECELRVVFPESFRRFLANFGWARIGAEFVYGLGAGTPVELDLVRNTLVERSEMRPPLPEYLIPVMNDGAGNHYCLDTDSFQENECRVVFWDHDRDEHQDPEFADSSYGGWLLKLLAS